MDKESLHERIEDYLAGQLGDEEVRQLEKQMADDAALAEEVALHRRLERVVADKEKRALRQTLAELSGEFPTPPDSPRKGPGYWLGGGLLLLLLGGAAFWLYRPVDSAAPIQIPVPVPSEQPTAPAPTDTASAPVVPAPDAVPEEAPRPKPPVAQRSPFVPNPALEAEMAKEPDVYYSVDRAAVLEAAAGSRAGRWRITFEGLLLTAMPTPDLELLLLDNSVPEARTVGTLPVSLTLIDTADKPMAFAAKKAYRVYADQEVKLKKGLYYGQLRRTGEPVALWMGRLELR